MAHTLITTGSRSAEATWLPKSIAIMAPRAMFKHFIFSTAAEARIRDDGEVCQSTDIWW